MKYSVKSVDYHKLWGSEQGNFHAMHDADDLRDIVFANWFVPGEFPQRGPLGRELARLCNRRPGLRPDTGEIEWATQHRLET